MADNKDVLFPYINKTVKNTVKVNGPYTEAAKADAKWAAYYANWKKLDEMSAAAKREAGMAKNFTTKPKTTTTKATTTTKNKTATTTNKGNTQVATPTTQTVADPTATAVTTPSTQVDSIASAYAPVTSFLDQQSAQTSQRYADNAANIRSIFDTLSTVRKEDIPRIQQQYAASLMQQQDAVAQRMAMQNVEAQQGRQGAATAAGELGSGGMPVPTSSMSGGAYTASNTDANAYQTTWNALQQVMNSQQQENVRAQIQGYDYQQVAALQDLQKSLEDKLMQISGNKAQVLSDIAQAKNSAAAAMNQQGADYATLQEKLANDLAVAKVRAGGTVEAAKVRAGASGGGNASDTPEDLTVRTKFANNVLGWEDWAKANGATQQVVGSMKKNAEYALAQWKKDNVGKTPTRSDILQKWNELYGKDRTVGGVTKASKASVTKYVSEYILKYLSLK